MGQPLSYDYRESPTLKPRHLILKFNHGKYYVERNIQIEYRFNQRRFHPGAYPGFLGSVRPHAGLYG